MDEAAVVAPSFIALAIHMDHQDCPGAEEWRRATGAPGFPRFLPTLHERYNPHRTYLKCEGCDTVVSHGLANTTGTESA